MENDIPSIVEMLRDSLLHRLGDEVELIFQYGSFVKGAAHQFSDIDISYIPVHESTWESITVMVGETMIDLYPMHWSHLERMANFDDLSAGVLLHYRLVYQRSEEAAQRMQALAEKLQSLQEPQAQPEMIRKALRIFQSTAYAFYLLAQEVAAGHTFGSMQQAQNILATVLHCLAVCNQSCIDTRKMVQVLALPKLPTGFAGIVERITQSTQPEALFQACGELLSSTRQLLLAEQRRVLRHETTYPAEFDAAYPELMSDLHRVMLACETGDVFRLKSSLVSLYHELARGIAKVRTGVEYSSFNTLSEYEQDLAALGFPALLPFLIAKDFSGLLQQYHLFGERLEQFLRENSVQLNKFDTQDELRNFLDTENRSFGS